MSTNVEFKEVAEGIQAKFDEFKKTNDKHIEGIEAEKAALSGKVDKLNEQITEFEKFKQDLEADLKKKNRPAVSDAAQKEYKQGFDKFLRKGDVSAIEQKSVNVSADSDGSYAVPEEFDRNILQLEKDYSPMRQVCNTMTISTEDYKRLVNLGGAGTGWVGETDERPETSTPKLAQITAHFGEIYANPGATQKSLDDIYFNTESWITGEVSEAFAEQEGLAFLKGDGTNKPKGLMAYEMTTDADKDRAFGKTQKIVSGSATDISTDELIDLIYATKAGYRRNASWMFNNMTVAKVRKLKDSEGNYLWSPGLQAGEPSRLFNFAIVENEDIADVAANAISVAFGDFRRGYTIVDRMGTRMLRDPYTNKPFVHFYTTRRTGGMLVDSNAVKFLQQAAS